ncbi:MAG: RNA-binding protein [Myxococcales bacterium]|nr:RNA-binding protein [Myxococcales bacterium]
MSNKLYVGGLSWNTTSDTLRNAFEPHGEVVGASVISDRETGRSRGFGFVEMASPADAKGAIAAMDGSVLDGRTLKVNEARDRNR